MWRLAWLWFQLASNMFYAGAAPQPNATVDDDELRTNVKRGYGVSKEPTEWDELATVSPWPLVRDEYDRPRNIVYYCYGDAYDAYLLVEVFLRAVALWTPAFRYSSLEILPDPACRGELLCLCTFEGIDRNTLAILDLVAVSRHKADRELLRIQKTSSAQVGYVSGSHEDFPHRIYFKSNPAYEKTGRGTAAFTKERRPLKIAEHAYVMAHEIGHVIGLYHEHQRPDVREWTSILCRDTPKNVEAADKLASIHTEDFPDTMSGMERLQLLCYNPVLAKKYRDLPIRWWVPDNPSPSYKSECFDARSIMCYGEGGPTDEKQSCRLTAHAHMKPDTDCVEVIEGGSRDPLLKSISVGDIRSVAHLYPLDEATTLLAEKLTTWTPMPAHSEDTMVGLRLHTSVAPAPLPGQPPRQMSAEERKKFESEYDRQFEWPEHRRKAWKGSLRDREQTFFKWVGVRNYQIVDPWVPPGGGADSHEGYTEV